MFFKMQEYKGIETSVLLDMLAQHTAEYTKMLGEHDRSEIFYEFEQKIHLLQLEINSRNSSDTTMSRPDTDFITDIS